MSAPSISFCAVPISTIVYAGPRTREEFDRLDSPETIHAWAPCRTTTLIRNDGRDWERRVRSKSIEADGVMVVIQWIDERPVGS